MKINYKSQLISNSSKLNLNLSEKILNSNPNIYKYNCDYCGKEIFIVFDDFIFKDGYSIYQGIQAKRLNCYKYSPIINLIRDNGIKNIAINELANSHTRIHSNKMSDLDLRFKDKRCFKRLCNDCFLKTYNRIKVLDESTNIEYSLSIVNDYKINKFETIENVLNEFNDIIISPCIIGKGSINNY